MNNPYIKRIRELERRVRELKDALDAATKPKGRTRDRREYLKDYGRRQYKSTSASCVYVIADGRGRIKVGKTVNLAARVRTLRTALPSLQVLGNFPGYSDAERELHRRMKPWRVEREWFDDNAESRRTALDWCAREQWRARRAPVLAAGATS